MIGLLFLWLFATLFSLSEIALFFVSGRGVSEVFFVIFSLSLLPLWIEWLRYIERDHTTSQKYYTAIVLSIMMIGGLFLEISLIGWFLVFVIMFSLVWFFDTRTPFLIAFLILIALIVSLLVDQKAFAETLAVYMYYALVGGVFAELVAPYLERWLTLREKKEIPPLFQAYLREMQSFLQHYITLAPFLFLISILYWFFQGDAWTFTLKFSVIQWIVLFLYFSLLFVPLTWSFRPFHTRQS